MPFYHSLGKIPPKRHTIFKKPDGNNITVTPTIAPRSKVRDDEDVEASRKQFYKDWLEKMASQ